MHKIRKTYGTLLLDSDIEDSLVMEQMGHSDIATTRRYYHYSMKNEKNKLSQIAQAVRFWALKVYFEFTFRKFRSVAEKEKSQNTYVF